MTSGPSVLVLRALGLGDLLTAVPALRALRRHLPGHRMVLAAPAALADAVSAIGVVDELLPAGGPDRAVPAVLDWSGPPPDLAVDLHGNGPPSLRVLTELRPARLIAFHHPSRPGVAGPAWRSDDGERARWCRLLRWYGIPADPDDLRVPAPDRPSPAPGAVVLHPGADHGSRRWPPERFAAVARALRARGQPVALTAGPAELPLARAVAELAGLSPSAVLGGRLSFPDLAAVLAGARAVVSGDTGPAHLATALGTPSVTLFGPLSPALWGPPDSRAHRALWHPGPADGLRPGDPHADRPDVRLLRITPSEVLDALAALPHRSSVRHSPGAPP
ncbi:glycosyltransferase family 9 protein [Kitasatospora sp. NPDC048194]|uniref:glycosyltransferase family 9 protein n=1 Tax=Kitasatospora sp. NPDC048194 TaxID=3364045 RepID=UPI003712A587